MDEREDTGPVDRERELVERFREVRKALGLSQEELSQRLVQAGLEGMNQMAVSRLEAGKRSLRFHEAVVIAEALGQSLPRLMDEGYEQRADYIRQTALEAQAESSAEQLADDVFTLLRRQRELIEVAAKINWSMDDVAYLMVGSLLPMDAIVRHAVSRFFHGESAEDPLERLTEEQLEIQDEVLTRYEALPENESSLNLLTKYWRRVNGVDKDVSTEDADADSGTERFVDELLQDVEEEMLARQNEGTAPGVEKKPVSRGKMRTSTTGRFRKAGKKVSNGVDQETS